MTPLRIFDETWRQIPGLRGQDKLFNVVQNSANDLSLAGGTPLYNTWLTLASSTSYAEIYRQPMPSSG